MHEEEYSDIMDLPHHISEKRPLMPLSARAAQFAPFAALNGYGEAVAETERITDTRVSLGEDALEELDLKLARVAEGAGKGEIVKITFFRPDKKKCGGSYQTVTGSVLKIDRQLERLIFLDGMSLDFGTIVAIDLENPLYH